ncbi:MAG: hypothetical protein OQL06_08800 [Gammaproteobacteria bacterium]|nr:hypothetical protein [Gammaproteobacteria bacterium]
MHNDYLTTTHDKQTTPGLLAEAFSQHEPGETFARQIKIRFLQQSANYLGADLSRHALISRYLQD